MDYKSCFNTASIFSTVPAVRSITAPRINPVDFEERRLKNLEKADKHILKNTSVNDNLKSIYIPLILVRNSMLILREVRDVLARTIKANPTVFRKYGKVKATERMLTDIKENLDGYEHQLHLELDDKRITLDFSAEDFYDMMVKTYSTLLRYSELELQKAHPESDDNTITFVACCHLVRMLLEYKDKFEQDCCKKMQECLKGTTLKIQQKNPIWHERFKKHSIQLIKLMEMPIELRSEMVSLYHKVMVDKIEKIDMVKLTDDAVKRRVDLMNI